MRILLTGGSGLLGQELQRLLGSEGGFIIDAPKHDEMDIAFESDVQAYLNGREYDLIIHAAAYTDVAKAENEGMRDCYLTNVLGTYNLLRFCPRNAKFVYISSEYVHNPLNYYSYTKKWAEELVINSRDNSSPRNYLIIRTLFKPKPWPYRVAFIDQYTKGDYVDVIAPMIVKEALRSYENFGYIADLGTGRKTMFQLARRTNPNVLGNLVEDYESVSNVKLPRDYEV